MGPMRNLPAYHTNPGKIFRGFFIFLLNAFDFSVKIVDTTDMQVITTSKQHNKP